MSPNVHVSKLTKVADVDSARVGWRQQPSSTSGHLATNHFTEQHETQELTENPPRQKPQKPPDTARKS